MLARMEDTHPPCKIDIYVDGCRLQIGARNPHSALGWGIVIVSSDNPEQPRHIYGGATDSPKSSLAENTAILEGLREACAHEYAQAQRMGREVHVTLRTDQLDRLTPIKRHLQHPEIGCGTQLLKDTVELMRGMNANIRKTAGSHLWMRHAHALASRGAWLAGLKSQEFIVLGEHYEGRQAEEMLARKHMADLQPSPYARDGRGK